MRLESLKIKNLLVIESAEIHFSPHLTVLTGETGAGKTVLTKSFDLLAGKPAKNLIRNDAKEAYVESHWTLSEQEKQEVYPLLEGLIELEEDLILARKITDKKSYALVNGQSCSNKILQKLFTQLLQMYSQDQSQMLNSSEQQRKLIDSNLKTEQLFQDYKQQRNILKTLLNDLSKAQREWREFSREKELLQFEYSQLEKLDVKPGEAEELFSKLEKIHLWQENADNLQKALQALQSAGELIQSVGFSIKALQNKDVWQNYQTISEPLNNTLYGLESMVENSQFEPEEEQQISQRLGNIHELARKHGCKADELPGMQAQIALQLQSGEDKQLQLQQIEERIQKATKLLNQKAEKLSQARKAKIQPWIDTIHSQLQSVALQGAQIRVDFVAREGDSIDKAGPMGLEDIELLFCSGPGLKWGKLSEVASGGERSRLMLLFNIAVEDNKVVLLDEPDTGIGGKTAHGVGQRIFDLSRKQQTIIISHLPQLAQRADTQFVVEKKLQNEKTTTEIYMVEGEDRIDELCRMSGHEKEDQALRSKLKQTLQIV